MGASVLDDKPLHTIRMRDSHPEPDGASIVLHEQHVVLKTEHLGKALHYLGNVIERI